MPDIVSMFQYKKARWAILLLFLMACAPTAPPDPKDLDVCLDSNDPSIYQPLGSDTLSSLIYERVPSDAIDPNSFSPNVLGGAQLDAYIRLVETVQKWSVSTDIPVKVGNIGSQNFIRITLTFISPELIEMALLNHYLVESPLSEDAFIERVNEAIGSFESRKEMVFLVTFTSSYRNISISDPNELRINANVREIKLFDTNGQPIYPKNFESHLGQDCCISRGYLSGYIAYPMFVYRDKVCKATLEQGNTTRMVLNVGKLIINGNENQPLTLTLRYRPFLGVENSNKSIPELKEEYVKEFLSSLSAAGIQPKPQEIPPQPNVSGMGYWQAMANYIWWYLAEP